MVSPTFYYRRLAPLLFLLAWSSALLAANIQVQVDRDPVNLDESFQILFTADGEPDDEPDFTPLHQDFAIHSQSQSSQVSVINGQYSRQIQWTLNAMAKRSGDLAIPPVAFGQDSSPALPIHVQAGRTGESGGDAAEGSGEVLVEVDAEPKNPYVQAQVLYTVRILYQVGLGNARLEEPKLDNAVLVRLGEDKKFATQRHGQMYQAIERRFALFPQQSGRLAVQPPVLEAELAGRHSLFNRFFLQQPDRIVKLRGKTVELEVRPIPKAYKGQHWLPVQHLELSETLSKNPPRVAAGEPLTRTLTLKAQGSTVGNLPELATNAIAGLQAYPDQPALEESPSPAGLRASRVEKAALIPGQAGDYALPEIAIPWWNTQTDREEIARLPARVLTATGGAAPAPVPAAADQESSSGAPACDNSAAPAPGPVAAAAPPWLWIGLAACAGLGWLATALAWWRLRRQHPAPTASADAPASAKPDERALRSRLREACQANDVQATRQALLVWAGAHWPHHPPRHLDELAARGNPALAREIQRLNQAAYGSAGTAWDGAALWQALAQTSSGKTPPAPGDGLEPLYR